MARGFLLRGRLTYPMRRIDGTRGEEAVSWLCSGCNRRAQSLRRRDEEIKTVDR